MVNQVVTNSYARSFKDFKQPSNYYVMSNTTLPQSNNAEKKSNGKKMTLYALGAGFGILALTKGVMSKSFSKLLDKIKISLEKKLAKDSKMKHFYRFALAQINNAGAKFESINNFTTLKDVLVQRLMYGKNGQRTFTRQIHEGITKVFDKISRNTVNSSYAKSQKNLASLNENIIRINENLLKDNASSPNMKNTVAAINARMQKINAAYEKGFGINARNERLNTMNEVSKDLFDVFWNASLKDIKNFRSKNMYNSYIAEDYLLPHKMKMSNEVSRLRQAITHDIDDSYKATIKALDNIQKFVGPTDSVTNKVITDLRNNLSIYKKLSGKHEIAQRKILNEKISTNLHQLQSAFASGDYTKEAVSTIKSYVSEIDKIISNSSKGELQEVLTLYKQILPRGEYLKLKAQVQKTVQALDEAIDTETVKYFDKSRDLKLGSAPTDIISIIGATGAVVWFLGKAKDKDERISAALQYGIPAVGGIATSLYSTAKLISGGKALAFGILSSWLINKVGVLVDDTRKKYSLELSLQKTMAKAQPDKV